MLLSEKIDVISPKFSIKSKIKPKLNLFLFFFLYYQGILDENTKFFFPYF